MVAAMRWGGGGYSFFACLEVTRSSVTNLERDGTFLQGEGDKGLESHAQQRDTEEIEPYRRRTTISRGEEGGGDRGGGKRQIMFSVVVEVKTHLCLQSSGETHMLCIRQAHLKTQNDAGRSVKGRSNRVTQMEHSTCLIL